MFSLTNSFLFVVCSAICSFFDINWFAVHFYCFLNQEQASLVIGVSSIDSSTMN